MTGLLLLLAGVWVPSAQAESDLKASINGDIKTFYVATIPYDNALFEQSGLMPSDPISQGILDGRLKVKASHGNVRVVAHHVVTSTTGGPTFATGQTGLGAQSPQLVDLSWDGFDTAGKPDAMTLTGRTDRLSLGVTMGPLTLTAGRQPVTLGHGLAFTPMDLVNPFFPTVVDQEYKPGVDALTADLYFGTSSQLSLITAYADEDPVVDAEDWAVDGMVYVLYGQHTVGRSDVGLMLGEVRNDAVVGLTIASSIGPVAVHADATYTQPDSPEEDPFVRGVVGALWAATGDLTLSGELYHQSLGAENPDGYLSQLRTERYARGELWLAGQTYASGSVSYQVTPLILGTVAVIANAADGSALLAPNAAVSVSDEVQIVVGGFTGLGRRPAAVDQSDLVDSETGFPLGGDELYSSLGVRNEFGLYPSSVYLQMKAYF